MARSSPMRPLRTMIARAQPARVGAHHGRLLHEPAAALARLYELAGLAASRDGLLAQHVLAGFQRADRPRHVQVVGQRIVDGIDLGIGQQLFVGSVGARDREAAAAARALSMDREAMATPRPVRPAWMAGMILSSAILATPKNTPARSRS
jgi:hypothetical protein